MAVPDAMTRRLVNQWRVTLQCEHGSAMGTGNSRQAAVRAAWSWHSAELGKVLGTFIEKPMILQQAERHVAILRDIANRSRGNR